MTATENFLSGLVVNIVSAVIVALAGWGIRWVWTRIRRWLRGRRVAKAVAFPDTGSDRSTATEGSSS
ncbi:hypothetical protein ACWEK2_29430 [Streptomyces albidoflavus]